MRTEAGRGPILSPSRDQATTIYQRVVQSLSGEHARRAMKQRTWRSQELAVFELDAYQLQTIHGLTWLSANPQGDVILRIRANARMARYLRIRLAGLGGRWDGAQAGWRIPQAESITAIFRLIEDRRESVA